MKRFYVIDEDCQTSYSAKKDEAEYFSTLKAARSRALHLANTEPGKNFYICQTISVAVADVMTASISQY